MTEPAILGYLYLGGSPPMPILRATLTHEIPDTAPRVRSWLMVCRSPSSWRRFARRCRDRRRANRARRQAVRAILAALAPGDRP